MKYQSGTEYSPIKVDFVVLLQFVICQYQLRFHSESVEVRGSEKVQILKIDILEQDNHPKARYEVLFKEVGDRVRSEFELEPILLLINGDCKILGNQLFE
jgi:hypothetical protein